MKTPQQSYPELAKAIGLKADLYLKREDLHPYGSHKGRAIPLMIERAIKKGNHDFLISSSGNAALAAIRTVAKHNENNPVTPVRLHVCIGMHIAREKLAALKLEASKTTAVTIHQLERPKQYAFQKENAGEAVNLRQSTSDVACAGYHSLGEELLTIAHLSAIFVPVSSGTAAAGIGERIRQKQADVALHIVQTTACHPIAEQFDTQFHHTATATAGAIVDRIAHRKYELTQLVKDTHGSGWIPSDTDIANAQALLSIHADITTTPNGALALAGLIKALDQNMPISGSVAVLICGL